MLLFGIFLAVAPVLVTPALALEPATSAVPTAPLPRWPDTRLARLEALALLQSLNADLLSNDSATLTLERWCATHLMADPAKITAERLTDQEGPAPSDIRALLKAPAEASVRHRRVRLKCGAVILSEADNFYVADRLTPEMNATLDGSDAPFGKVVRALDFRRRTLASRLLWTPLPPDWELSEAAMCAAPDNPPPLSIPSFVLEHRAVLTTPEGTPFSALVERYTSGIFTFRRPPRP